MTGLHHRDRFLPISSGTHSDCARLPDAAANAVITTAPSWLTDKTSLAVYTPRRILA